MRDMELSWKWGRFVLMVTVFVFVSSGVSSSTPECVFTNAYWSVVSAVEGQQVSLTVEGTDCDGEAIDLFVIWEDDLIGDIRQNFGRGLVRLNKGDVYKCRLKSIK